MNKFRVLGAALLLVLLLGTLPAYAQQIQINGAGSTLAYPIYSKWFDVYHKLHPNIQFNYQAIGSGGGIKQLLEGTVDLGASDAPMNDEELHQAKTPILHFMTVLGAAVPTYNISGVNAVLNFTQYALAGIYLGKITKWNDPAIQSQNPNVKLPNEDIVVVHRSDGSGTTYMWTDFLSKTSPEWKSQVGCNTSVRWPVGLGGKGSEGVMGIVKQTPGAIGYIELIYSIQNHIPYGRVQNAAGVYVEADLKSVTEAAAGAAGNMPADFRVSIANAPGKGSYPISSFTWLLVPQHIANAQKGKVIVDFLKWMLVEGQKYTEPLAYSPLPHAVVLKEERAISKITY